MKNNLRFCLIGRGSIGTRHLKNIKSLGHNDIIAFSKTPDQEKDVRYKDRYGIATVHTLNELDNFKPDVFIIANPTASHMEFSDIAVNMGCHVFMEKPLSHNLEGVDSLKKKVSDNSLVFCLANNFRFHPVFTNIKKLIDDGAFGEIYFSRIMAGQYLPDWHPGEDYTLSYSANKKLGGGVVLTLQHEIDYAYWLFGPFNSLKSQVKKVSNLQIDVEDIASVIIEAESGQLIEIHLDYLQRPAKRSIQIQGSKGSIDYCFTDKFLRFYDFAQQKYKNIVDLDNYDTNKMYIDEIQNFIKCIAGEQEPKSSLDDSVYILKTCMEIKKGLI